MRVLVAPNAFKGSLDAIGAARAIVEGFARAQPKSELIALPVADGGDGTAAVLVGALGGRMVTSEAVDAVGRRVRAEWALSGDGSTAVIEVARACGLSSLSADERNPMIATSYGAGLLVRAALDLGCRRVVVGLGGSATVDGGAGLVEALGARLLSAQGTPIERGGAALARLDHIDVSGLDPRLRDEELVAACDVDSELLGDAGAARRFGPQKGASPAMIDVLERNLAHMADVVRRDVGRDLRRTPRAGAAGGMGLAVAGIMGGRL